MNLSNKVGFAIGTGRCGTLFLHQLMLQEPAVASSHERNPESEAFHRYCRWHRLPVDDEGFLAVKEREILAALEQRQYSFEASPYLSLSVKSLHQRFGARFLFLIRRPDRVVTSFAHKGFYSRPYIVGDSGLATGFQDQSPERFFTFFARICPRGDSFRQWNDMTQVGKVAWFWRSLNERTLEVLHELPPESYRVMRIEDFGYAQYLETGRFLGFEPKTNQADFDALRTSQPHAFWRKRNVDQWSVEEVQEFESQVGELSRQFGYEFRVKDLAEEAKAEKAESVRLGRIPQPRAPVRFWRVRSATARWLRTAANSVDVS